MATSTKTDPQTELSACCVPLTTGSVSIEDAVILAGKFKALGDPTRVRLLSMVASTEAAEACVCDLTEPVGLSQPTVSHHLKVLVDAGLLTRSKRGIWSYYALVPESLVELSSVLGSSIPVAASE